MPLDDAIALFESRSADLLELDEALNELARTNPRQARIVERLQHPPDGVVHRPNHALERRKVLPGVVVVRQVRRHVHAERVVADLHPAGVDAGLAEGDAHVIRNAGGRASDDAIRSLVISYKLLGTREWFVIHHTNCGMETFSDEIMRSLLASSLKTASVDASGWHDSGDGPGSSEGNYIDWLTITDNARSVVEDVKRIKGHPLVPPEIPVYGYIYDCKNGELIEVPEAMAAGRAG